MLYSRCCLLAPLGNRCSGKKPCSSFLLFCGTCFRLLVLSAMEKLKLKCKELFSVRETFVFIAKFDFCRFIVTLIADIFFFPPPIY